MITSIPLNTIHGIKISYKPKRKQSFKIVWRTWELKQATLALLLKQSGKLFRENKNLNASQLQCSNTYTAARHLSCCFLWIIPSCISRLIMPVKYESINITYIYFVSILAYTYIYFKLGICFQSCFCIIFTLLIQIRLFYAEKWCWRVDFPQKA